MTNRERISIVIIYILTIVMYVTFAIWMNPITGLGALIMTMVSFILFLEYGKPI
ncbi:membrane protein [Streptomyces phage BoomerJR]|uniref:Membrane protein n=1 Tax=Streptomyces phage BoomerJR TaxID=2502449 RepID=A0A411CFP1_9CAUD|nr:membrane protein [Streptomyces phage BoomerJR]UVD39885.1 membrane protein [Streptomyces phage Stanimal]WNM73626.1 membrane protein [Streptomyces phage Sollertia]